MQTRLEAEEMLRQIELARLTNATEASYLNVRNLWLERAGFAADGPERDAQGRPIIDSLADFAAAAGGDLNAFTKYGVQLSA